MHSLTSVSLRSLVSAIGLVVALLVSAMGPLGYAVFAYVERAEVLSFKAELNAARAAKYIYSHEKLWQYQRVRLAELVELPQSDHDPIRQRIVDTSAKVVLEEGPHLAGPLLRRAAPIVVKGVTVGRLEIEASLIPLFSGLALVMVLTSAVGLAAYFAFRVLPLRVLDRTLGELRTQNTRFDAALNNMSEGLCMFDGQQRLVVCNDRYARMYGLLPEQVRPGTTLREILDKRIAKGMYAGEVPEKYARGLLALTAGGKPSTTIQDLNDGRAIAVNFRPMAGNGWVATHEDITDQKRIQERIAYMAQHDGLTDLANRQFFREQLDRAVAGERRQERLAVLCLDLDRFKEANDSLGHASGDALLRAVAERLRGCVRDGDTVARLGGDEFAILQVGAEQPKDATALAIRVLDNIGASYEVDGQQVVIGTSVGIAVSPDDGTDADQLLRNADLALYRAKSEGRATYRFFESGMDARMKARRSLELDLRKALANQEFELHYQPIVALSNNEVDSFEALLRWIHPTRGMVSPAAFIPLAEETGLILPIGEWVLRRACSDAMAWPEHIKVAVNLSPVQFKTPNLVATVFSALAASGLAPSRLELEITESVLLLEGESTQATLHKLRDLGARISMDDFGTGYSSLSYLRSFPFDKIKIDRSFITDINENDQSLAIVHAVAGLGISLGMVTTAEGVETREQLERLRAEGCTQVQGYYFSAAKPASEIPGLLATMEKSHLAA